MDSLSTRSGQTLRSRRVLTPRWLVGWALGLLLAAGLFLWRNSATREEQAVRAAFQSGRYEAAHRTALAGWRNPRTRQHPSSGGLELPWPSAVPRRRQRLSRRPRHWAMTRGG